MALSMTSPRSVAYGLSLSARTAAHDASRASSAVLSVSGMSPFLDLATLKIHRCASELPWPQAISIRSKQDVGPTSAAMAETTPWYSLRSLAVSVVVTRRSHSFRVLSDGSAIHRLPEL